MPSEAKTAKAERPAKSLADEIAAAETKLRILRERKKEEERRNYERNQKAILVLLRDEGLDQVAAEKWRAILPKLRLLLDGEIAQPMATRRVRKSSASGDKPGAAPDTSTPVGVPPAPVPMLDGTAPLSG